MERKTFFVDVLLPLPLPGTFTYRVPFEMNNLVKEGVRVVVQFGKKKVYTALVYKIHEKAPEGYMVKYILSVLDHNPIVINKQFVFWEWIAKYYLCTKGEVMSAALPSALKLASESKIILNPQFNGDYSVLNDKEYLVAEALSNQKILTITELTQIVEQKKVIPLIKTLIEKGLILIEEKLKDSYKPKHESFVRLTEEYQKEENLNKIFDELNKRAFKQLEILMSFISITQNNKDSEKEILRPDLLKSVKASNAQLNSLVEKGVFEIIVRQSSRLIEFESISKPSDIVLNNYQNIAFDQIKDGFNSKNVVLLHGVTSSGKTEIYIKLIEEVIAEGKKVLFLLPEIALTTQIINRLRKYFGKNVGVYHSKYSENERVEIWNKTLPGNLDLYGPSYDILLGTRSSLFLPIENLGLIIVDEEHDYSYKQYDPAPRYNARDGAVLLANLHKAKVLLGSATPSIESYYNAQNGKYHFVELKHRYGGVQLPEILVADIKDESRKKKMKSHFSSFLLKHIEEALENKEQIILFQNRRGFSLRLECESCNWSPECKNCDITLTYHKHFNQLKCHYCGFSTPIPASCPSCSSTEVKMKGFGTEKIEEELPIYFPDIRIARMDLDTTRSKYSYQQLINDFEDKKIDVLVGTQMVTKGLDFDNVSIVGILNADNMISFPDFRSFERSFQMFAQVSGRAGRKAKRGKVIIQTYNPYHMVIRNVIDNNYKEMYDSQLLERRNFKYPPFYRLILITLKERDSDRLNAGAEKLGAILRKSFGKRILGPEYPLVSRVKNFYMKNILLKIEKEASLNAIKDELQSQIKKFHTDNDFKRIRVVIDVDPL